MNKNLYLKLLLTHFLNNRPFRMKKLTIYSKSNQQTQQYIKELVDYKKKIENEQQIKEEKRLNRHHF